MRTLLGIGFLASITLLASQWTYSVSGWLVCGLLPALWLDRQFIRLLPWPEPRPLAAALLLRLAYVAVGAALVGRHYPWVPAREVLAVGGALSMVAFAAELILGWACGASRRRLVVVGPLLLFGVLLLMPLRSFHQFHTVPTRTPTDLGLPYEEITIQTADGVELAAWYIPHSQPRGSILFLHGHGGNRHHVLWTVTTLHELGLSVLAIDFRGHGDSPGHTSTFGHREVADVLAAEAYLAERLPGLPIYLSGVSYGGAVGLQSLPHLARVRAAWIDSAFARLTDVAENRFAALPDSLRHGLIRFYSVVLYCDSGFWGPDIRPIDALKDIHIPLHFSHGSKDDLVPYRNAQEMFDCYQGPKEFFRMEGATHMKRPVEVNQDYLRRLKAFFAKQLDQESAGGKIAISSQ